MKTFYLTTCSLLRLLPAAAGVLVLSIGAARGADYSTTILGDSPSAYYRFEETTGGTANDSSSNSATGAATIHFDSDSSSPLLGAAGVDTNSFKCVFPGPLGNTDFGYVDIPASTYVQPVDATGTNSGPFSAELWVEPNGYPQNWSVPIEVAQYPNGWNIYVSGPGAGNGPGQSYFYLDMRPSIFAGYGDFLISFGQWYHLVLTFDGTNAMFYINGVAHGPINGTGFVPAIGTDVHIASGAGAGWLPFNGNVDEVAFYDYVLTSTQVTNHYAIGKSEIRVIPTGAGITAPPVAMTNYSGVPVTFSVTASGTTPITYTWLTNGVATGPNANSIAFTPIYPGDNNDQIQVVVSNIYGPAVTSAPVALTVSTALNILAEPASITRNVGSHAVFHVTADGAVPITYKWSVSSNGGPLSSIPGATNDSYWLTSVQSSQSGNAYTVVVSNSFTDSSSSNSSQTGTLTVQDRQDPPVSLNGYGAIVAADSPVAFWRLNETSGSLAEDAVGTFDGTYTPNFGTVTYGATTGVPHDTNTAATLANGATIQVPWAPELNPDTGWTVETWLNPSSLSANGGDYRIVMSSEYNLYPFAYNGWYIYQQPGNNFIFVPQPANAFIFASPNDPAHGNQLVAGNWYHLVVTDDTTNFTIYINGTAVAGYPVAALAYSPDGYGINSDGNAAIPTGPDGNPADGGNFVIGQRTDGAFNTFEGSVEDTAIYQYALSPAQVASHYADAVLLTITKAGSNVLLTWPVGLLQQSGNVLGTYTNVVGATSPYTNAIGAGPSFYRVHVP